MTKSNVTPNWLSKDYVEEILQKYFNDEGLHILSLEAKPALPVGENYASILTRLNVKCSSAKSGIKELTYLLKRTFDDQADSVADVFSHFGIYQREMDMYELILPRLAKLLFVIGDTEKLFADTVHVSRENFSIIFEDLSLENYVTLNRVSRLDKAHVKMALKKLAKMHATAAVLNERSPGIFAKNFDCGIFNRKTNANETILLGIFKAFVRYVGQNSELSVKYHAKLLKLVDNYIEYTRRAYDVTEDDFMTLIHGDYWTTNIMFRYNEDKSLRNVIPIDFQFSSWSSPAVDLHFFFNSSLHEELRLNAHAELLQFYLYLLRNYLKLLGYKGQIPSLYKFNLEFEARSFIALSTAFVFQPMMIYVGEQESNVENLLSENADGKRLKDSYFENETVQKYVANLLPIFDKKGLLDLMD